MGGGKEVAEMMATFPLTKFALLGISRGHWTSNGPSSGSETGSEPGTVSESRSGGRVQEGFEGAAGP